MMERYGSAPVILDEGISGADFVTRYTWVTIRKLFDENAMFEVRNIKKTG